MLTKRDIDEHLVSFIEQRYGEDTEAMEKLQGFYRHLPWTRRVNQIGHLWVTVGLPLGKTPLEHLAMIQSITPRVAALVGASAVYECHPHPHVHILGRTPEKYHKGNLITVLSRALKLERRELVDVKASTRVSDFKHRQAYLAGDKASAEKEERVALDAQVRAEHGIPDIISL